MNLQTNKLDVATEQVLKIHSFTSWRIAETLDLFI